MKMKLPDQRIPGSGLLAALVVGLLSTIGMGAEKDMSLAEVPPVPDGAEMIGLGAGCFWCVEAVLEQQEGILAVTSGYMGGQVKNPTYRAVCAGTTGHAEIVRVVYDPKKLPTEHLLKWFWKLHDPTTLNRQGNDVGTQYRSAIYYTSDAQKNQAELSKKAAAKDFAKPIVTEITKASVFYPAEKYHQEYYRNNKSQGYCR